jgi:hypothetical protein
LIEPLAEPHGSQERIVFNKHTEEEGAVVFAHACKLGPTASCRSGSIGLHAAWVILVGEGIEPQRGHYDLMEPGATLSVVVLIPTKGVEYG